MIPKAFIDASKDPCRIRHVGLPSTIPFYSYEVKDYIGDAILECPTITFYNEKKFRMSDADICHDVSNIKTITKPDIKPLLFNASHDIVMRLNKDSGGYYDIKKYRKQESWKIIRLMYIANTDPNCFQTFKKLPKEIIWIIELFIIAEPYFKPKFLSVLDIKDHIKSNYEKNTLFTKEISHHDETGNVSFLVNIVNNTFSFSYEPSQWEEIHNDNNFGLIDGVIFPIDIIEGISIRDELQLKKLLLAGIRPICFLDRIDRLIIELQMSPEEIYETCRRSIESVNIIISTYHYCNDDNNNNIEDWKMNPSKGTVLFGCLFYGWAFSIDQFATLYYKKFGVSRKKLTRKLWGDHFYDITNKKWNTSSKGKRAFCNFIIKPLMQLHKAGIRNDITNLIKMTSSLGHSLTTEEQSLRGKSLIKVVMKKLFPAGIILMRAIILHIPSPKRAQQYRMSYIYDFNDNNNSSSNNVINTSLKEEKERKENNEEEETKAAMIYCDPNGPLMVYIAKMIPINDGTHSMKRFLACGRIYSGTIKSGKVKNMHILIPNIPNSLQLKYRNDDDDDDDDDDNDNDDDDNDDDDNDDDRNSDSDNDIFIDEDNSFISSTFYPSSSCSRIMRSRKCKFLKLVMMNERFLCDIDSCTSGNMIGILGIDDSILSCGTITNSKSTKGFRFIRSQVNPHKNVKYTIKCEPKNNPILFEVAKRVNKTMSFCTLEISEYGEWILYGPSQLLVSVTFKDIEEWAGVPLELLPPTPEYLESILSSSNSIRMISPNGHNTLTISVNSLYKEEIDIMESSLPSKLYEDNRKEMLILNKRRWNKKEVKERKEDKEDKEDKVKEDREDIKEKSYKEKEEEEKEKNEIEISDIWGIGPNNNRICSVYEPNLLINCIPKDASISPNEIKDSVRSAWIWCTGEGPLIGAPLRGVRVNIKNAKLHSDAIHRGGGQIIPLTRKAILSAILGAKPVLLQKIYHMEITFCPGSFLGEVYSAIHCLEGSKIVKEQEQSNGSFKLIAHIPQVDSLHIEQVIRSITCGRAFCIWNTFHWEMVPMDQLPNIIKNIRKSKGLPPLDKDNYK